MLYHVTFLLSLTGIREHGLTPGLDQVWRNRYDKQLGEKGKVYLFTDRAEAVKWAFKQEFDFKMPCVVLEIASDCKTEPDPNALMRHSVQTAEAIDKECIVGMFFAWPAEVRAVVEEERSRYEAS